MGFFRSRIIFLLAIVFIIGFYIILEIKDFKVKRVNEIVDAITSKLRITPSARNDIEVPDTSIKVDSLKGEISFIGDIQKDTGWVQHLIYLEGYKWLKEKSAIVSPVKLKDLQLSFAQLSLYLWDSLWLRLGEESSDQFLATKKRVKLFIEGIPAESLIIGDESRPSKSQKSYNDARTKKTKEGRDEELGLGDFLFLGSPYFDYFALGENRQSCVGCPLFDIEKKTFEKLFIRPSGKSGYYLNTRSFPRSKRLKVVIAVL